MGIDAMPREPSLLCSAIRMTNEALLLLQVEDECSNLLSAYPHDISTLAFAA